MNQSTLNQLKTLVEQAVQPVRASTSRKRTMQEELLAHITAVFEEEAVVDGDEQAALQRTLQRFGNPAELASELQESVPASGYVGWLADRVLVLLFGCGMSNHNRLYNIFLVLLGVNLLCGLGLLMSLLGMAPDDRPRMLIPQWSLPLLAFIHGLYLLTMTVTLVARLVRPAIGKRLTRAMNLLFLIAPPFGTALGIYGLWKVDREPEVRVASS